MPKDRKRFRAALRQGIPQLGVFVQSSDPAVVELAGLFVGSAEEAKKRIEQVFSYLIFSTDQALLFNTFKNTVNAVGIGR